MAQILLFPDIDSHTIIKQKVNNILTYYCIIQDDNTHNNYQIELWSNLTTSKEWKQFPFVKMKHQGKRYFVIIDISDLAASQYEFTLRVKTLQDRNWTWYGKPQQNGRITIVTPSHTRFVPSVIHRIPELQMIRKHSDHSIDLYHFSTNPKRIKQGVIDLGPVDHSISGHVSFLRKGTTWLTPISGASYFHPSDVEKHQLILYQDSERGDVHLWMALGTSIDCWLSFGPNNTAHFHCPTDNTQKDDIQVHLLFLTTQNEYKFYDLVKFAIQYYYERIADLSDQISQISKAPEDAVLVETLGYCTWNAFGKELSYDKISKALSSLKDNNIPVNYLLLDDGWGDIILDRSQLASFDVCPAKFPMGDLQQTVQKIKERYPFIKYVGIWHTLCGYWHGISKELARRQAYNYFELEDNKGASIGLIKEPQLFYQEFYNFLNKSGIDFVKVDNQGGFLDLICDSKTRLNLWNTYRKALIDHSDALISSRVIHCMSLNPYILLEPSLSFKAKATFRNSDDFFPDVLDSHAWHIYSNAINLLWTRHYPVIADWDMFQSDHPFAEYHASSRAMSGGPVYLTDVPGKHNIDLIEKLVSVTRNGSRTLLRSRQPPVPTFKTALENPMGTHALLCLYNINREENEVGDEEESAYAVYGFWNTGPCIRLGVVEASELIHLASIFKSFSVAHIVTGLDQGIILPLFPLSGPKDLYGASALLTRVAGFGSSLAKSG
ncbi:hypothetical protein G6F43_001552 [Rhizopus delemar]|nr:hypothetical protein G6F43_001552 [Rhizopus delemar]